MKLFFNAVSFFRRKKPITFSSVNFPKKPIGFESSSASFVWKTNGKQGAYAEVLRKLLAAYHEIDCNYVDFNSLKAAARCVVKFELGSLYFENNNAGRAINLSWTKQNGLVCVAIFLAKDSRHE